MHMPQQKGFCADTLSAKIPTTFSDPPLPLCSDQCARASAALFKNYTMIRDCECNINDYLRGVPSEIQWYTTRVKANMAGFARTCPGDDQPRPNCKCNSTMLECTRSVSFPSSRNHYSARNVTSIKLTSGIISVLYRGVLDGYDKLQSLDLSRNQLVEVSSVFNQSTFLRELIITNNMITRIVPLSLNKLTRLETL